MGGIPDLPDRNPGALPAGADPVPAPAQAPPTQAASPQAQGADPLAPVDDTRYNEESVGWVLLADMAFGGVMPWLMASADVAQGRVDENGFEEARIAHQQRLNAMREQHPQFVQAAEQALPMLAGAGIGILKPAKTIAGAAGRGAAGGATIGAVQGFTSGPEEVPSGSSERMGNAVGGALQGSVQGAVGGGTVGAVQKRQRVKAEQQTEVENRRAESQRQIEESQRARREARIKQDTETEQQRPKQPEQTQSAKPAARKSPDDLDSLWRNRYVKSPKNPDPEWRQNRERFMNDPEGEFMAAADANQGMDALVRKTNMPPAVIAAQLSEAQLDRSTPGRKKLFDELADVLEAKDSVRRDVSQGTRRRR